MISYVIYETPAVIRSVKLNRNFPGGEVNVQIQPHSEPNRVSSIYIEASMRSSDELMQFVMTVDALRRYFKNAKLIASLPYLPYARQDRVCNEGEPLSIAVLANILNSLPIDQYQIYDPHSDVSSAVIKNATVTSQVEIYSKISDIIRKSYDAIIAPDAGAQKKAYKLAEAFGVPRVITANKIRDVKTGRIVNTELSESVDGLRVAVFDDICDGGATFIELAKHLSPAKTRDLFVTHGIFSKGVDHVAQHYNKVFSTNSFNPELSAAGNLVVNKYFYN